MFKKPDARTKKVELKQFDFIEKLLRLEFKNTPEALPSEFE